MEKNSSRTAVLVCQGRAVADGRMAVERFSDPIARQLLTDTELVAVERARGGARPKALRERMEFEMLRASAEVIVPRTVAIDDAARGCSNSQLVVLGAGLDGRAWRMTELADVDVTEVDHPASQADKRSRVGDLAPTARSIRFIPVDFTRDSLDVAMDESGHDSSLPTTWIWEGVVPYLTSTEVTSTMDVITRLSAPGSRLIVNYQIPSISAKVGLLVARLMAAVARRENPTASEPRRSAWTPTAMKGLMSARGWRVDSDDDLFTLAGKLPLAIEHRRSLGDGRVMVADR